jgi:predicted TPR repeat methyltransferase
MTVSDDAARILARAYGLRDAAESQILYRDWASSYDRTMLAALGYVSPRRTAQMLAELLPVRPARILDVGCGTGLAAIGLARYRRFRIDGLDVSPAMLAVARARGIYESLQLGDLNRPLPVASSTYDALICTGTFTHGHVGSGCLRELFRILRPGGRFAATIHRDVYEPLGFRDAIGRLVSAGTVRIERQQAGGYYSQSREPEGYYFLWRKN